MVNQPLTLHIGFPSHCSLPATIGATRRLMEALRATGIDCHITADSVGISRAFAEHLSASLGGIPITSTPAE